MNSRLLPILLAAATSLGTANGAFGYAFILDDSNCVSTWKAGTIPMLVKLNNSQVLADGTTQLQSVLVAMQEWNVHLGTVQFTGTGAAPGTYDIWDGTSEIAMDSAINSDGESVPFGEFVLAVTISFEERNTISESDIIFNSARQWDSFRGSQTGSAHDIRRVAAHELGHVLGLDHPDEATPRQDGWFLMNSRVSYYPSIEGPQPDDISGAQALYGSRGFIPANDNFSNATSISLSGTIAKLEGTNVAATKEPGEPDLDVDDPGGRTVWWKWAATYGGTLTVTTVGSNFDTLLGAYTGGAVNALTQLALNDDVESGIQRQSTVTINVDYGTTYYFAVDGWDGVVGRVTLNLSIARDPARSPPYLTTRPLSRNVVEGANVVVESGVPQASGSTFVWRRNGQIVAGQTGASLQISPAGLSDRGYYEVVATNALGSVRTRFNLNVAPANLTLVAWGDNSSGQSSVPANLGPLFTADSGSEHVVALRGDGTVVAWGGQRVRAVQRAVWSQRNRFGRGWPCTQPRPQGRWHGDIVGNGTARVFSGTISGRDSRRPRGGDRNCGRLAPQCRAQGRRHGLLVGCDRRHPAARRSC